MLFTRNLRWAAFSFLLWSLAYNLSSPLLPLFARELGGTPLQAGLVGGFSVLGALVLVLPLSILSDRFGRRAALVAGWLSSGLGLLTMTLSHTWWGLLPGAFLSMAAGAALPTLNTLAMEELPDASRGRGFALLYAAAPLGALVGAALNGLIAEAVGLRTTTFTAGICGLLATLALLPIEAKTSASGSSNAPLEDTPVQGGTRTGMKVLFAMVAGGGFLMVAIPGTFVTSYLREVSHQTFTSTGLYSSLLALAQLAWSLLFAVWPPSSGRLRIGHSGGGLSLSGATLLAITTCLVANGLFGLLLPAHFALAPALALIFRGSQFTLQSLGSALLGDVVPRGPRMATRMTILSAVLGLGAAGAPVVGGWLYGVNTALPFWVSGAAALAGAGFLGTLIAILPRDRRQPTTHAT